MKTFARAVATGFAFTLGAALFRKLSKKLGLEEDPAKPSASTTSATAQEASEPSST